MEKLQKKEIRRELSVFRPVHVLPEFCNEANLRHRPGADDTWRISYEKEGKRILLEEVISKDSGRHILELTSIRVELNEKKETGIHHHPDKGHEGYHIQFTIRLDKTRTIRIFLDNLDKEGYQRCVRGFLRATKEIIEQEMPSLITHFFKENIDDLVPDQLYLKKQVLQSTITENDNKIENKEELNKLKKESHLVPFF
jgi:hypothetical protein